MQLQSVRKSPDLLDRDFIEEAMRAEVQAEIGEGPDLTSPPALEGRCVLWNGPLFNDGRGRKTVGRGRSMTASRWVYMKHHGLEEDWMEGKVVSAVCFNKRCVNADHLYLNDNPSWRFGNGSTNPNSRLNADDVSNIRREYRRAQGQGVNNTGNAKEIMEKYGITRGHLSKITRRETWKHVE